MFNIDVIFSMLGNLASVVAVGLSVYSVRLTIKEQKEIRNREQAHSINEQKLLWYNKIVLDNFINDVNLYVAHSEKLLLECETIHDVAELDRNLSEVYQTINDEFRVVCRKLNNIKIFSKQLFQVSNKELQDINDIYSNIINDAMERKHVRMSMIRKIPDFNLKLTECLYYYGIELAE